MSRGRRPLPDPSEVPRPETCDFCGVGRIRWYRTNHAQAMALDATPDAERGNVRVIDGIAHVFGPADAAKQRNAGSPLYLPHRVTCTAPEKWPGKSAKPARRGPQGREERPKPARRAPEPPPALFELDTDQGSDRR